ncbi:MAG: 3-deoxy-D-manno-octulosonic acid transferase [Wenzhouxiangellaceae bacterium]|nr:3-deoxy-D-manno-octulosonic acid transferase [Wenzhouxiangellaceae bacterium]
MNKPGSIALGVYRLAAAVLAPLAGRRLGRAAGDPELRARRGERDGDVPEGRGEWWLHAASVGEVNAAEGLIHALLASDPERRVVVTTLTATGAAEVARRFGDSDRVRHLFAPLDTRRRVRRWLARTRPEKLVLVETEIWPEMLAQCRGRGIPVAVVSARLSERAFARYRRWRALFAPELAALDAVLCQTPGDRDRFAALGVPTDRLAVTGNLKLDAAGLPPVPAIVASWRAAWNGRPAWVAGSTHEGEEAVLAAAHRQIRDAIGDALLICVPRHPERAGAALRTLEGAGVSCVPIDRLTASPGVDARNVESIVVDRLGLLAGLYQVAGLAVVCGSLVPGIGGHNLVEPALAGKPVITGRWTGKQREMVEGLRRADALIEVDSAAALAATLIDLFSDEERRRALGERARDWAESRRGALARTLARLAQDPRPRGDSAS